jgi:hypothetical protein
MLDDFQIFENYMASDAFKNLPDREKEEFITSYNNFLEEEMDTALEQARFHLQQKNIADLFMKLHGHLDKDALLEKDSEWNRTFGFRPLEIIFKG